MSVIWLTGLSGSGKSTIAAKLATHIDSQIVDGDTIRRTISSNLKHGKEDRDEHYNRVIHHIKTTINSHKFTIAAFVSPDKSKRDWIKSQFKEADIPLIEIYIKTSLQTCERRDPKCLYARFRKGDNIKLAGLTEEYIEPDCPSLVCNTDAEDIEQSVSKILKVIS